MRASAPVRAAGIALLPVLAACGGDARAAGPVVRDSAGVRIVESSAPAWKEGEGWRLSAEPALDVGMADGPPEYQFGRVTGAVRLGDGTVVVADDQSKGLRFFDQTGRYLKTVGREGGGPAEFRRLDGLAAVHDTLVTSDFSNRRLSMFSAAGSLIRSVPFSPPRETGFVFPVGALPGGGILLRSGTTYTNASRAGLSRDSIRLLRVAADGGGVKEMGRFPGSEMFLFKASDGGFTVSPRAFGRAARVAVGPPGFAYGSSDTYEVRTYDRDGRLLRLIRRPNAVRPVSPEDVSRYREFAMQGVDASFRAMEERLLAAMPFPENFPAFDDLRFDRAGNLWVRDYRVLNDDPSRWTVFDPEGRMLGTVATPARFRVMEIGADYVLGVWKDELDVEHVRMFTLEKPAEGR